MEDILKKLQIIFQDFFDDNTLAITAETQATDIEDWDSWAQMNLMVLIEKEFKIKFMIEELSALKDIGAIIAVIQSRLER